MLCPLGRYKRKSHQGDADVFRCTLDNIGKNGIGIISAESSVIKLVYGHAKMNTELV